jgi:two-component sensor histidine kinase
VEDDGVGLPPELDFRTTSSLGLQLVCVLAAQLGGTVELGRGAGARFEVAFKELA